MTCDVENLLTRFIQLAHTVPSKIELCATVKERWDEILNQLNQLNIKLFFFNFRVAFYFYICTQFFKSFVHVWSIVLYGTETQTMSLKDRDRLETFEKWCWRIMEGINWTQERCLSN